MIKSKQLLLLLGVTIFVILVIVVATISRQEPIGIISPLTNNPSGTPRVGHNPNAELFTPPAQNKININGVVMNNFYKSQENRSGGNITFFENQQFTLGYVYDINLFTITIISSPFSEIKPAAETQFVKELGISQEDACKLPVQVQTPYFVNYEESQQVYKLSFCK